MRMVVADPVSSCAQGEATHAYVSTEQAQKKKGARARCRAGGTRRACLARRGGQAKGPGSGHASRAAHGASAWLAQALIGGAISHLIAQPSLDLQFFSIGLSWLVPSLFRLHQHAFRCSRVTYPRPSQFG